MKTKTLKIKNDTLELKAEGWADVRLLLLKVQFICELHDLKWLDVEHRGFTMMVERLSSWLKNLRRGKREK